MNGRERGAVDDELFRPLPLEVTARTSVSGHRLGPCATAVALALAAWLSLSVLLVGLGLALSAWAFDGVIGDADRAVVAWFVRQRNAIGDQLSAWGSRLSDTVAVVGGAALAALVLLVRRHWRSALFVVLAPTIEVTSFLVVTFVVARDRPPVPRLDAAPPTSSFPSGHVAAAVAFYVALALVVAAHHPRATFVRRAAWGAALVVPLVVAWSRLYRGMHHPTDVIVGYAAGANCVVLALLVVRAAGAPAGAPSSPSVVVGPIAATWPSAMALPPRRQRCTSAAGGCSGPRDQGEDRVRGAELRGDVSGAG